MFWPFPSQIRGLEEAVETIEAWAWVQQNTPALEGDPVARQEVRAQLLYAHDGWKPPRAKSLGCAAISLTLLPPNGFRADRSRQPALPSSSSHGYLNCVIKASASRRLSATNY